MDHHPNSYCPELRSELAHLKFTYGDCNTTNPDYMTRTVCQPEKGPECRVRYRCRLGVENWVVKEWG